MGSWAITIHGHGIHDNGKEEDADAMLKKFVAELRAKGGHVINSARFTAGTGRELKDGEYHYE